MAIDTHAHIYTEEFDSDREAMLERARNAGVHSIVMPNVDLESMPRMLALSTAYPSALFPLAGLHPCSVKADYVSVLAQIELLLDHHPFVGIGEVGMDLYWDKTFEREQEEAFLLQSGWALQRSWPVIIHSRNALDRLVLLIRAHFNHQLSGIFHCFSGSYEQAVAIIEQGFYLGIGGVVTYKNSTLPTLLKTIGLERVVLETDAPYLSPVPYRGKRNEPAYLTQVIQTLATTLGVSYEQVVEQTTYNAHQVFKSLQ